MILKNLFFGFSIFLLGGYSLGQVDTIYVFIESGTLALANGQSATYTVYSDEPSFKNNSKLIIKEEGAVVCFKVKNNDVNQHGFEVQGYGSIPSIAPGTTALLNETLNSSGVFRYFDPINYPYNAHIGLSGTLHVKATTDQIKYYYWDIREHETNWNSQIVSGGSPVLTSYDPNQFTINGNIHDGIELDTLAKITGNVGTEYRLVVVDHGLSIHSLHFHGYHGTILFSSKNVTHVGREKDTFPVYPEEILIVSITPDKPGEYPVHDHNLIAVTSGGLYHAGMITTLVIAP